MKQLIFMMLTLFFCSHSQADNINKRTSIKPRVQTKINKQIARSYLRKKEDKQQAEEVASEKSGYQAQDGNQYGSGTQTINSFSNVRYAPREVITSVKGDIVNICFHCR